MRAFSAFLLEMHVFGVLHMAAFYISFSIPTMVTCFPFAHRPLFIVGVRLSQPVHRCLLESHRILHHESRPFSFLYLCCDGLK